MMRSGILGLALAALVGTSANAQPSAPIPEPDPGAPPADSDFPRPSDSDEAPPLGDDEAPRYDLMPSQAEPTEPPPEQGNVFGPQPAPAPAPAPVAPAPAPVVTTTAQEPVPAAPVHHTERHRHFWIDAAVGYSWINLVALDQSNFTPDPKRLESMGLSFEGGAGIEFSVLRVGLAGSYAMYKGFDVATAELDVAIVIPIPIIEPYIEAGFGYGWIRNVDETDPGTMMHELVPIRGMAFDLGIGLDVNLSDAFQIGANVDASVLNLQRQRVTEFDTISNVDFTKKGTALGLQIHGFIRATFQF